MSLKERLAAAMAGPPKVTQAELAIACGVTQPSVNDWLSGRTKTIRGAALLAAARRLQVDPDWLATGRGRSEMNVKQRHMEVPNSSQPETFDAAILSRALFWLDFEERSRGVFQPVRRAERLIALYRMIQADGGELSPENTDALIDAARRQGDVTHGRGGKSAGSG